MHTDIKIEFSFYISSLCVSIYIMIMHMHVHIYIYKRNEKFISDQSYFIYMCIQLSSRLYK